MRRYWVLAATSGLLFTALAGAGGDGEAKELKRMEGTWAVTINESGGKKTSDEENKKASVKLVVEGSKYKIYFGDKLYTQGKLKLDPAQKPRTIEAIAADGPYEGKVMPGIYELEGDNMRVCFATPGKDRPKDFSAGKGSGHSLLTYKRLKQ
jgi:uncharacterized protein (TIGR03067 family)